MEYVIVEFEGSRPVYVDGTESGTTNKIFRVGAGLHEFHLGMPLDYYPRQKRIAIRNTNSLEPEKIPFDRLTPS